MSILISEELLKDGVSFSNYLLKGDSTTKKEIKTYTKNTPDCVGFVWVLLDNNEYELAYFHGGRFQTAESAGDYEGLSVDYYDNVIGWAELSHPNTSEVKRVE